MRRSPKVNAVENNGTFVGFILEADFVAEHEWGVKGILKNFTTNDEADGIERRRINIKNGDSVCLVDKDGIVSLVVGDPLYNTYIKESLNKPSTLCSEYQWNTPNETYWGAWDEKNLIIRSKKADNIQTLYRELLNGNVAIWLGGGGVFKNAGLCLAIIDRAAPKDKEIMLKTDLDRKKLLEAAEKTGIRQRIEEAREAYRHMVEVETGQHCYDPKYDYFALSPKWKKKVSNVGKTKYNVVFWLNPTRQSENNYGYFTVEELDLWLEGKGPVPKGGKQ